MRTMLSSRYVVSGQLSAPGRPHPLLHRGGIAPVGVVLVLQQPGALGDRRFECHAFELLACRLFEESAPTALTNLLVDGGDHLVGEDDVRPRHAVSVRPTARPTV